MPVIHCMDLALRKDEILDRLPLSSPAFSSRPAPALVAELLDQIEQDQLLTPKASYEFHRIMRVDRYTIALETDTLKIPRAHLSEIKAADSLVFASWTLGKRISTVVSKKFEQRQFLAGFLLHEIASLLLFRLGENLFDLLSGQSARPKENIGNAIAPGDGVLKLSAQGTVLTLSGASRIGIDGGIDGPMSPLKSATAIAPVGSAVKLTGSRWSCEQCQVRDSCRLRSEPAANRGHERLC